MVAIVSGNGIGLLNTSGKVLGQNGIFGNASTGSSKEGAYVNIANGNLTLQDQDDFVAAVGIDLALTRTYNSQGNTTDGMGAQWKLGVLKRIDNSSTPPTRTDGDGTVQTYKPQAGSTTIFVSTDGDGTYDTLTKNSDGSWTWRDNGNNLTETYDASGRIVSVGDEMGARLNYTYGTGGQLMQITDGANDTTTFSFTNGLLTEIRTALAGTSTTFSRTSYTYDTLGRLSTVRVDLTPANKTDASWYTTTYTYDGNSNRIAGLTQSDGTSLSFTYVSSEGVMKVATVTQATGDGLFRTTRYDYSVTGQTSVTDPLGNVSVYTYDASKQLTQVTQRQTSGTNIVTTFAYNANGDVISVTGPNGKTTMAYDSLGNQTKVTTPTGSTITRTFGTGSVMLSETLMYGTADSSATRYAYDAKNRLRFVVSGEGRVTEYRYDAQGNRARIFEYSSGLYTAEEAITEAGMAAWSSPSNSNVLLNARVTDHVYDARGLVTMQITYSTIQANGNGGGNAITRYTYDQAGQLLSKTDPENRVTSYAYDGLGRLLATTDAGNNTTSYAYDDAGHKLSTTVANGTVTVSAFNAAGELASMWRVGADGSSLGSSRFTYDADGRLVMTVDTLGIRTFTLYDEVGRRVADVDGDGSLTEYIYDTAGNVVKTTAYATRIDTRTLVDASGRYLARSLGDIRPGTSQDDRSTWNTYDKMGRLIDSVDGEGNASRRTYDTLGRLVSLTERAIKIATNKLVVGSSSFSQTSDAADRTTQYTYDKDGNLLTTTVSAGYPTERRYDAVGRLIEVTQHQYDGSSADVRTRNIYNTRGELTGTVTGGYLTENVYSPAGNLMRRVTYGTPISMEFSDNATIDALRPSATSPDDRRVDYEYNALNQLSREIASNGTVTTYLYDKVGNLTTKTVGLGTSAQSGAQYRYDGAGRVIAELPPAGVAALATTDSATVWARYATTYTYDADGRRSAMRDANGNRTLYYYDNDDRLAYTVNALGEISQVEYNAFGQVARTRQYANRVAATTLAGLMGGGADKDRSIFDAAMSTADSIATLSYDHSGNLVDQVDALQLHTIRTYNSFREVASVSQPGAANSTTPDMAIDSYARMFYDKSGRLTMTVSNTGRVTEYKYNNIGKVTDKITHAALISVANIATATQPPYVGNNLEKDEHQYYLYDARGLLTTTFSAVNSETRTNADDSTTVVQRWQLSRNEYDASGNLVAQTTFANLAATYDAAPTAYTAAAASDKDQVTRYFYDGQNHLAATATAQRGSAANREWSVSTREYDAVGNLVATRNVATTLKSATPTLAAINAHANANISPADPSVRYAYDSANRLIAKAVAQGVENGQLRWSLTSYGYDNVGNLVSQTQSATLLGSSTSPTSTTPEGWRAWLVAGAGTSGLDRTTRIVYDALNRPAITVDATGAITSRVFDAKGNVIKTIAYATAYTATGPIPAGYTPTASTADRVGRTVYDADNRPVYTIDGLGEVTEYRYDARGNVVKTIAYATPLDLATLPGSPLPADIKPVASANDRTERRVYDQAGNLRYAVDAAGYVTETVYDGIGHVTSSIAWDYAPAVAEGAPVSAWATALAGKPNRTRTYAYDAQGNLLTFTDVDKVKESYTYDGLGNRLTYTNKAKSTWTYLYDAAGRMIQETSPQVETYPDALYQGGLWSTTYKATTASIVTTIAYDAFGNVTARTEAAGTVQARTTQYVYDAAGRQVKTILPSVQVYDGSADPKSSVVSTRFEKDSGELSVVVTYNAFGDAVANKDVGGNRSEKAYDAAGRIVYERDALNYVTEYQRDTFGNVARLVRHATPYTGSMADPLDKLRTAIGTNAGTDRAISYAYDVLGRQTASVETATYVYDPGSGQQAAVLAARTVTTEYDRYGEVVGNSSYGADANGARITSAAAVRYYFDARGNKIAELSAVSEGKGYLTTFAYDAAGNLKERIEYATAVAMYGDARDRTMPALPAATPQDRKTSYTYDASGRVLTETRIDPTSVDNATGQPVSGGTAVTKYGYDALGNKISEIDALGGAVYTRYDVLGRVTAVKKSRLDTLAGGITAAGSPLTEFKLDVYGNVVLRIEYAQGASGIESTGFTPISTSDPNNRITATTYDKLGHATQVVRGVELANATPSALTYSFTSYDAFGRVAKQWSTFIDVPSGNLERNMFAVTTYDALGRVATVATPANIDNVAMVDTNWRQSTVTNSFNAFGELNQRTLTTWKTDQDGKNGKDVISTLETTIYDQAGRAWRSDSGDGVTKVTLFDIQGNATSTIRSSGDAKAGNPLLNLPSVAQVFSLNNLLRTDTSYDLLGHATAITSLSDLAVLQHDAQTGAWTEVRNAPKTDDLLIVSRPEDSAKTVTVRYRLAGTNNWMTASSDRIRTLQGYRTFSTAGLAGGSYEFQVLTKGTGEAEYVSLQGAVNVAASASKDKDLAVIQLYAVLFKRAPTIAEINQAIARMGSGAGLAQLAQEMLDSAEGKAYLNGTPADIVKKVFSDALGRTGAGSDTTYASDIAVWIARFQQSDAIADYSRGQAIVDLIDQALATTNGSAAVAGARTRLQNRATVLAAYLIDNRGSDATTASRLLAAADAASAANASIDPVKTDAINSAAREFLRQQIAQLYVILLGRAPDPASMVYWYNYSVQAGANTIELVAQWILDGDEAKNNPTLYPVANLTQAQYLQQLVTHAYQNMLGRMPTAAELASGLAALNGSNGTPALTKAQFILQLADTVSSYNGGDTARQQEKVQFNNRVAVAYAISGLKDASGNPQAANEAVLRLVIGSVTATTTPAQAIATAVSTLTTAANFASTVDAATKAAMASNRIESMRYTISRLYVALLNRAPDTAGMAFFMAMWPEDKTSWEAIANSLLIGAESKTDGSLAMMKSVNGTLVQRTNAEFVQRVYELALGQAPLQATVGMAAEIANFTRLLDSGQTRAGVAVQIVNGMLGYAGLTAGEQALKDKFDNRAAVGVAIANDLGVNSQKLANSVILQLNRDIIAQVTSTDTQSALNYAYVRYQATLAEAQAANGGAASQAASAIDAQANALNTQLQAQSAAASAGVVLDLVPKGALLLNLTQIYVGLLGRAPDVDGLKFYFNAPGSYTMQQIVQAIYDNTEVSGSNGRFPPSDSAAVFVAKVYASILIGGDVRNPPALSTWPGSDVFVQQLNSGVPRAQVWSNILNSVVSYTNNQPDAIARNFLDKKAGFSGRVADALKSLSGAAHDEIDPIQRDDNNFHIQLDQLQAAMKAAISIRDAALAPAKASLNAANAAGDGLGDYRLKLTLMYATLLKRGSAPTLEELSFWSNNNAPLADVAQAMMTDPNESAAFANLDNTAFVRELYLRVLNRTVNDTASLNFWTSKLAAGVSRGAVVVAFLENYLAYSDSSTEQLVSRNLLDNKLYDMLTTESGAATTVRDNAYDTWNTALQASNKAETDYKAAVTARDSASTAKTTASGNASYARTIKANASNQSAITYIYMGMRGYTDIAGLAFWLTNNYPDSLISQLMPTDSDNTAFVSALYSRILGRAGTTADVTFWVNNLNNGSATRLSVAKAILYSSEATSRLNTITSGQVAKDNGTLDAFLAAETAAINTYNAAVTTANNKYTAWQSLLPATTTAKTAYDKAVNVAASMSAVAAAYKLFCDANGKYSAASTAQEAYNTYKIKVDAKDAELKAAKPYADAIDASLMVAWSSKDVATAANNLAAAVANEANLGATAGRVRQVAQLYTVLIGSAPSLSALNYWTAQLASSSLVDVIGRIMAGPEAGASGLYAAGMSNDAFVSQMFRLGTGRDISSDPTSLRYWSNLLTGSSAMSRPQLVASFIQSLGLTGNYDTIAFDRRVAQTLGSAAAAAGTLSGATGAAPANIDLADYGAAYTALQGDAAGKAQAASNAQANNVDRAARLYIAIMDRSPDAAGLVYWTNAMATMSGATDAAIAQYMLASTEAMALYPASMSNASFAGALAGRILGRAPTSAELAAFGSMTRAAIVASLLDTARMPGTSLVQQQANLLLNSKVAAALTVLKPQLEAYVNQSAEALRFGKLAQAANPVDKHIDQAAPGTNTQVQGGSIATPLTTYTVDRWGNILSMTDPRDPNWITTYTYNGNDQLLSTTTPFALANGVVSDTSVTSTTYDRLGRVVATTDGVGNVNKVGYDSNGNVITETHADTGVVASTYDLFGQRLSVQTRTTTSTTSGVKTLYAYDHFGNLQSVTTGAAVAVYGFAGDMGTTSFTLAKPTSRQLVETYEYDQLGRRIKTFDADGVPTQKQYDAAGNVVSETDALGNTSYRTYDALGHLIAQVDATGTHRQTWTVDSQGRVTSHANLDKNTSGEWVQTLKVDYGYDNAGRLISQESNKGQKITYAYVGEQLRQIYDQGAGTGQLTSYAYDRAGNRIREETVYAATNAFNPGRRQNNTSTYDLQNRLASVKDDLYTLSFEYDKNGNRTATHSSYGQESTHAYNTYDAMNRQLIVNGAKDASGNVVMGAIGHVLTYDLAGNRLTDSYVGTKLTYSGSSWSYKPNDTTTETYAYDSVGRLSSTKRDGLLIDMRYYDAAGRVVESGMIPTAVTNVGNTTAFDNAVAAAGINKQFTMFAYNQAGHLYRQVTRDFKSNVVSDIYLVNDKWINDSADHVGGYDANGNLLGYTAVENGKKIFYYIKYTWHDGAQQTSTSVRRDGETVQNTTTTELDVNGNRAVIRENGVVRTRLWYDADGHVQQKSDKGVNEFALIVNGRVLGYENQKADNILGTTYSTISQGGPQGDATFYNVQSATEKLSTIADAIWGDQNLWYLIADANDLNYDSTLSVGQTLRIPQRATTVHNDADTFRPYDANAAIGDTTPLPTPAKADKHGCGVIGKIAAIAIAAVVTYFAGTAAGRLVGSAFLGGVIGGAAGSIASQGFSMATGMQDKFSWSGVATSAIASGVSFGIADKLGAATNWQGAAVRGALSNTLTQGINIATGLQNGFDWRSVAASAAGAAVGNSVYDKNPTGTRFGNAFTSGFAAGTTTAILKGGRVSVTQVAADAFGNALGSSLAGMGSQSGGTEVTTGTSRPISQEQAERNMYGGMTSRQVLGGDKDWLSALGAYDGSNGTGGNDERIPNYQAPIPQVVVDGGDVNDRLNAIFGLTPKNIGHVQAHATQIDSLAAAAASDRRFYASMESGASNGYSAAAWHIGGLLNEVGYDLAKTARDAFQLVTDSNTQTAAYNALKFAANNPGVIANDAIQGFKDFANKPFAEQADSVFKFGAGGLATAGAGEVGALAGRIGYKGVLATADFIQNSQFVWRPTGGTLYSLAVPTPFGMYERITTVTSQMSAEFQGMGYLDPLTNTFKAAPIGETMAVDHIFPSAEIAKLPGFNTLTKAQMTSIIQDTEGFGNLQPLPKTFNSSKGSLTDWSFYKGQDLHPEYINNLMDTQNALRQQIQDRIMFYRALNAGGQQ